MKKKISAFVIMLLFSGFVFSGTFGDREKRAVRSFLSGGEYIEYVGEGEEEEGVIYPRCTNANGLPPKQITFGTRVRKQKSTNIVVTDEEDDTLLGDDISDVPGVEDLFINDDPDDSLSDFDDDFDDEEDDIIDDDISIDDLAEGEDDYI